MWNRVVDHQSISSAHVSQLSSNMWDMTKSPRMIPHNIFSIPVHTTVPVLEKCTVAQCVLTFTFCVCRWHHCLDTAREERVTRIHVYCIPYPLGGKPWHLSRAQNSTEIPPLQKGTLKSSVRGETRKASHHACTYTSVCKHAYNWCWTSPFSCSLPSSVIVSDHLFVGVFVRFRPAWWFRDHAAMVKFEYHPSKPQDPNSSTSSFT